MRNCLFAGRFRIPHSAFRILTDPREVLIRRARVHHQEQLLRPEPIDQQIVHHAAFLVRKRRVMCLSVNELRDVIGRDRIHKIDRTVALDPDLAHMRDVKKARVRAAAHMLFDHARILHGHVPPAKIDHLPAQRAMHRIQRRLFQFCFRHKKEVYRIAPPMPISRREWCPKLHPDRTLAVFFAALRLGGRDFPQSRQDAANCGEVANLSESLTEKHSSSARRAPASVSLVLTSLRKKATSVYWPRGTISRRPQ